MFSSTANHPLMYTLSFLPSISFPLTHGSSPVPLLRLPDDLIREILDEIEADPDKLINLDRRGYLSRESFALPPPPEPDQAQDIANFRLVCKRFSNIGAIYQFTRIATRFSLAGFERLEKIATNEHLAKHVKKFSYLVPQFYVEGRDRLRDVLPRFDHSIGALDISNFEGKARAQKEIIRKNIDSRALLRAMRAFVGLQHVQILKLQDRQDTALLVHLRQTPSPLVELKWAPAFAHCTQSLGTALLKSHSPCSRVSIPAFSVQNPAAMLPTIPTSVMILARNLKSLELHFDEGFDLQIKMQELSGFFKELFSTAESMQAIHIGFPSHRPLDLRLEDVFHNIVWDKLSAFGIQAWKLNAEEIILLLRRHRTRLRGLRLRDVLLNEGSYWTDILTFLREDMPQLDWVSLRRIGYTNTFDRQWVGAEIPDDPPGGASDSDDDDEDEDGIDASDEESQPGTDEHADSEMFSDDESSLANSGDEDDHGRPGYEMSFPRLPENRPSVRAPRSSDNLRVLTVEELGDNGETVSNSTRKLWEQWVIAGR